MTKEESAEEIKGESIEKNIDEQDQKDHSDEISEIEALNFQIQELEIKAAENLDGWQRSQAEFANYKKRMTRDQDQMKDDLKGNVIRRYLEILDDLERALGNKPQGSEGADWAAGIELVYRKLISYVEAEGVRQMEIEKGIFDPNMHEAISQEESDDHESGEIVEILQPGYLIGDRVLRPAVVKVAK